MMITMPVLVYSCSRTHFQPEPALGNCHWKKKKKSSLIGHSRRFYGIVTPTPLISFLEVICIAENEASLYPVEPPKTQANLIRIKKRKTTSFAYSPKMFPKSSPQCQGNQNDLRIPEKLFGVLETLAINRIFFVLCLNDALDLAWGWQMYPVCTRTVSSWSHIMQWLDMRFD